MKKFCIVNGDDFGASEGINRGIAQAHLEGILTSTSLMVTMPGAAEAALLSQALPGMSVGIHLTFTVEDGAPLIDFESPSQCEAELSRQWSKFIQLFGSTPTHMDCHHNVHRDPRLAPVLLQWADQFNVPLREHSSVRYFSSFYGRWGGESHPEQISVESLCCMLAAEIDEGVTELSCHPGYVDDCFESEYSSEREAELRTLCDPLVRQSLAANGIELISYRQLRTALSELGQVGAP